MRILVTPHKTSICMCIYVTVCVYTYVGILYSIMRMCVCVCKREPVRRGWSVGRERTCSI